MKNLLSKYKPQIIAVSLTVSLFLNLLMLDYILHVPAI
jgi:hypothetical protein